MVIWRKISYNWRLVNNFVMQKFHLIIVKLLFCLYFPGEHPRFGAHDVCPFIPVSSDITMDDCVACAKQWSTPLKSGTYRPSYTTLILFVFSRWAPQVWRPWCMSFHTSQLWHHHGWLCGLCQAVEYSTQIGSISPFLYYFNFVCIFQVSIPGLVPLMYVLLYQSALTSPWMIVWPVPSSLGNDWLRKSMYQVWGYSI